MATVITIEEKWSKDDNGKTLLSRVIKVKRGDNEKEVYRDSLSPKDIFKEDTPFNVFERWIANL